MSAVPYTFTFFNKKCDINQSVSVQVVSQLLVHRMFQKRRPISHIDQYRALFLAVVSLFSVFSKISKISKEFSMYTSSFSKI